MLLNTYKKGCTMFAKRVMLITLSLVSIAAAMTPDDTENNSSQLAIVAAQATTEQAAEQIVTTGQIVAAPAPLRPSYAVRTVYKNADLWRFIRSYLEMNLFSPTNARMDKLLNPSNYLKTYVLSPHLGIVSATQLTNSHLVALSTNTFFDTINITSFGISSNDLCTGLKALQNTLYPKKVNISGHKYIGAFRTEYWSEGFEMIDGKIVYTNTNEVIHDAPQVVHIWPPHGYHVGWNGELIRDGYDFEFMKKQNEPDIFKIFEEEEKERKKKQMDFFSQLSMDSLRRTKEDYPVLDFDIIKPFKLTPPAFDISPILANTAFESLNLKLDTMIIPIEPSVTEIHMKPTKRFSVFSLKQ